MGFLRRMSRRWKIILTVVVVVVLLLAIGSAGKPTPAVGPAGSPVPQATVSSTAPTAPAPTPGETPNPTPASTMTPSLPPAATRTPPPTPEPKPTPTPTPVDDIGKVIPGLTVADVKLNLQDSGFECSGPAAGRGGTGILVWTCEQDGEVVSYRVEVWGESATSVRNVTSTVTWFGTESGEMVFDEFLGYMATLPYERSSAEKAQAWVTGRSEGESDFGPAHYSLTTASTGRARILAVTGNGQ